MTKEIVTMLDACHEWVREFNSIPTEIISILMEHQEGSWQFLTPGVYDLPCWVLCGVSMIRWITTS